MSPRRRKLSSKDTKPTGWVALPPEARITDEPTPGLLARRAFGWRGKRFPRLVIAMHQSIRDPFASLTIAISRKEGPGGWWNDCDLPLDLVTDACELMTTAAHALMRMKA